MKSLSKKESVAVKKFIGILKKELRENLSLVKLYGSKARGDPHKESDTDLLVFVKEGDWRLRDKIVDIASDLLLEYEVLISPTVVNEKELKKMKRLKIGFIENVEKEGIDIWKAT